MKFHQRGNGMTVLLALLAATLLLGLALELGESHPTSVEASKTVQALAPENPPQVRTLARPDVAPLAQYEEILERPVFRPDRQPYVAPEAPETAGEEAPEAAKLAIMLTAVVIQPDQSIALFKDRRSNKSVRVREGEVFEGWKLERVDADRVEFTRPDSKQTLVLRPPKPKYTGRAPVRKRPQNPPPKREARPTEVPEPEAK